MKIYMIMKNGKYVKDYTDGKVLTTSFKMAENIQKKKLLLKPLSNMVKITKLFVYSNC